MESFSYPLDIEADVTGKVSFLERFNKQTKENVERDLLVARVSDLEELVKKYRRVLYDLVNQSVQNLSSGMNREMLLTTFGTYIEDLKYLNSFI